MLYDLCPPPFLFEHRQIIKQQRWCNVHPPPLSGVVAPHLCSSGSAWKGATEECVEKRRGRKRLGGGGR